MKFRIKVHKNDSCVFTFCLIGMFDTASRPSFSCRIMILNVALYFGSSKQGNAIRACVGSKYVLAITLE